METEMEIFSLISCIKQKSCKSVSQVIAAAHKMYPKFWDLKEMQDAEMIEMLKYYKNSLTKKGP